jgi:hypothetical protein
MVKYGPDHPYRMGANIITNVNWMQLTEQVQAEDPEQIAMVQKLFDGLKLSVQDFNKYKDLSSQDLEDETWIDAPLLTAINRERFTFTHRLAKVQALLRQTVVIRWRVHLCLPQCIQ